MPRMILPCTLHHSVATVAVMPQTPDSVGPLNNHDAHAGLTCTLGCGNATDAGPDDNQVYGPGRTFCLVVMVQDRACHDLRELDVRWMRGRMS